MIDKLVKVPNDDFRLMETIDPEQFDNNNKALVTKIDEIVDYANSLGDITDGASGADKIGATPIPGVDGDTVQEVLEGLRLAIQIAQMGQIVDGSITDAKLNASIKIGNLANLSTTNKSNIVSALNEVATSLNNILTTEITSVATANKVLRLNADSKLPANITGDAHSVDGKHADDLLLKSGGTMSGAINMNNNELQHPCLSSYMEKAVVVTGTDTPGYPGQYDVVLDLSLSNTFIFSQVGITNFTITNPPPTGYLGAFTLIIDTTASSQGKYFPASVKWEGGILPNMGTLNVSIILTFVTINGGTKWCARAYGTNFAN